MLFFIAFKLLYVCFQLFFSLLRFKIMFPIKLICIIPFRGMYQRKFP